MTPTNKAHEVMCERHAESAAAYVAEEICVAAELRGYSGIQVAEVLARTMAALAPVLAGEVLAAVRAIILAQPITKIIRPDV